MSIFIGTGVDPGSQHGIILTARIGSSAPMIGREPVARTTLQCAGAVWRALRMSLAKPKVALMKVSELKGPALDAWVVKALGGYRGPYQMVEDGRPEKNCLIFPEGGPIRATTGDLNPSTNWAHGGPIIESERIRLNHRAAGIPWCAQIFPTRPPVMPANAYGETPLIAAMRAYVASRFGDDLPDE